MKYPFSLLISLFLSSMVFGQNSSKNVRVKGTFKNVLNKSLRVSGIPELDSTSTDGTGNFSLETNHLKKPGTATIFISKEFPVKLFVAPGYNLEIVADATNEDLFYETVQMSGTGSSTNAYWKQFYLLYKDLPEPGGNDGKWYGIPTDQFVNEALKKPNLDSFAHEVSKNIFGIENRDFAKNYFKKIILQDLTWTNAMHLFQYSGWNSVPTETVDSFILQVITPGLLVSDDQYIDNDLYKKVMSFGYLEHLYRCLNG